jgi:deoxyguanosine kinase
LKFTKPPYNFITIEGNIGSGKTTLAKMLANDFNAKVLLEQFEDNPFLPEFYKNQQRFALHVELSFLAERYIHIKETFKSYDLFTQLFVSDYMFQKCAIFAKSTLKQDEYELFSKLYSIISPILPSPDVILYLFSRTEKLQKQIKQRGREYEQSIPDAYLEKIQKSYFKHFKQLRNKPILVIDTENIDFVKNKTDYEKIKQLLFKPFSKGINYVNLD